MHSVKGPRSSISSSHTAASTASPMVETTAADAGLQICSSDSSPVNLPGGECAILYQLSPDCSGSHRCDHCQGFGRRITSTEAMNAAMATAQNTYQNWNTLNTAVFTSSSSVLVVQGAPGNKDGQQIGAFLIEQDVVQVIE